MLCSMPDIMGLWGGIGISYLSVRGKMFHCRSCGSSFVREFVGGAQLSQIGDENVYKQISLNKKLMPLTYDCENQGYYFHEFIVCEACLKTNLDNYTIIYKVNNYLPFKALIYINEKFSVFIDDIAQESIDSFISMVDMKSCQQLHPDAFAETIGHKQFKLTFRKNDRSSL